MGTELTSAQANLELALLDARTRSYSKTDAFTQYTNAGLPPEIVFRLEGLWETTRRIGGKIVHIGRILVFEIARFIKENPNLAVGVALGAAVGTLSNLVPFIGQLLAPLAVAVGAFIGGIAGARLDRGQ